MESQEHIFMINSSVEWTRGNRAINAAEDENYGEILKSGDNTLLRYKIFDGDGEILPLEGLPCEAVIKKEDKVVYRTPADVDAKNIVNFKITEVLPSDRNDPYTIEFVITQDQDTLIFPSDDRINLYIYPSSLSADGDIIEQTPEARLNDIVIVAVNEATQELYSKVDNISETLGSEFEANEAVRQQEFEANEADRQQEFEANEAVRESNESGRESNESGRESNESGRQSNESGRQSNESGRQSNESVRQDNELVRQAQEESREIAENQREEFVGSVSGRLDDLDKKIAQNALIMGVEWDKQADPTLTRIGGSKDFVANIGIGDEVVQNDFDYAPIYREITRETDDLGNTFVRIPRFYIRKTDGEGLLRLEISKEKIEGFYLPYVFWDFENSKELDYFYYGAYMASLSTDGAKLESKPGSAPLVSRNIVQFRDFARANGSGYQQLDIHAIDVIRTLFFVEFATLNSQSIHPGYTSRNNAAALTGGMDGVVASSGSMGTSSSHQFVYRGIEDLWGNTWQFVDGVNINDHQAWVCEDANSYASNVFAAPYQKLSYVNADTNGYVKEMGFDPSSPYARFAVTLGAGTTTYYSDHYHQNTGQRVALLGGSWSVGAAAGLSFWSLYNSSASATSILSGRLLRKAPV